jgi:hypothetical protein
MSIKLTFRAVCRGSFLLPFTLCACTAQQDNAGGTSEDMSERLPSQLTINSYCEYMAGISDTSKESLFAPKVRELFEADGIEEGEKFINDFKVAYITGGLKEAFNKADQVFVQSSDRNNTLRSAFVAGCIESLADASKKWHQEAAN